MEQKLGRGLSAIFGNEERTSENSIMKIDINMITPNEEQPRKYFDEDKLKELSDSIALHGIIQPLVVRQKGNEYELLAGERRLRASKMAGLTEVPVHIIQCSDKDILALSLIENIQRDDLNAIEEAEAFKNLINEHQCTQENLAFMLCKSRSYITNSLRLLTLPDSVKDMVKNGQLSSGHAKLLVGHENATELAQTAIDNKMSVKALDQLIKERKNKPYFMSQGTTFEKYVNPDEEEISNRITNVLGMKSKLKINNNGGILTIYCNTCEQLESLTQTLLGIEENNKAENKQTVPSLEWL